MIPSPGLNVAIDCTRAPLGGVARREIVLLSLAVLCLISCICYVLRVAPTGLADAAPTLEKGLLPEWTGSRAILRGRNPYDLDVAQPIDNQLRSAAPERDINRQKYAYPVYFAFLFLPLAVLPFDLAQKVALASDIVLTAASLAFWSVDSKLRRLSALAVTIFAFASYPTMLALQLRQPTVLIAAMLSAVFFCVRSSRLFLAGFLAGLTLSKPQLAIPVLLPLTIWSLAGWRSRKVFLLSLISTFTVLLTGAELVVPGWIPHWIRVIRAYSHYAGASPLLLDILPRPLYAAATALLIVAVVWTGLKFRETDLLFAIAFSTAAFQLMLQFQIYNELLLLPATLWILERASEIKAKGQFPILLWACSWVLLGAGWTSQVALAAANLLAPSSGVALWQAPLAAAWLYPWPLFLTLALSTPSAFPAAQNLGLDGRLAAPSVRTACS
jgi:hypothetical protein